MIERDGREVLDRLSRADTRLVVIHEGRCTLSHDQVAQVITALAAGDARGNLLLDETLLDLQIKIGQKIALHESDPDDYSALELRPRHRRLVRHNRETLLFDEPRRRWWAAAQSLRHRRLWRAARWAAGIALVLGLAVWFGVEAYRAAGREAEVAEALRGIGRDQPDPGRFVELTERPDLLIEVVERQHENWVRSPETFGAMSFALEEAWLWNTDATLRNRLLDLVDTVRNTFFQYHTANTPGFEPPPGVAGDPLNPWVELKGGEFVMGADDISDRERPPHRVSVSTFSIQKHEVTNEEYRRFNPTHDFPDGRERHPAAGISWYAAAAYASWLGASLPTEAQWEYAARGTQGRRFPWGPDEPTGERAVFKAGSTAPVGSRGEGGQTPEGFDDMAGNVWEWCRDRYDEYPDPTELVTDPLGPTTGVWRVLRGGSFGYGAIGLRAAFRDWYTPDYLNDNIGFRVVSSRLRR